MVAFVNTEIMAPCPVNDPDHADMIGEMLADYILSQAGHYPSGAQSWLEKVLEE